MVTFIGPSSVWRVSWLPAVVMSVAKKWEEQKGMRLAVTFLTSLICQLVAGLMPEFDSRWKAHIHSRKLLGDEVETVLTG